MVNNPFLNVVGRGSFGGVARIPLIYLITFQVKEYFFVWCCFCGCF